MEEERERGRIASIRVRRLGAINRRKRMLLVFQLAREEGARSYQELADWLTMRGYVRKGNKRWTKDSVANFLTFSSSAIDQANFEHDHGVEIVRWRAENRLDSAAETARKLRELKEQRQAAVDEAITLQKMLRGEVGSLNRTS